MKIIQRILHPKPLSPHQYIFHRWLPLITLAGSLVLTYWLWQHEMEMAEQELAAKFQFRVHEATNLLQQRMLVYQQALSGIQSLYSASQRVDREEFRDFTSKFLSQDHHGLKEVGYVALTRESTKSRHEDEIRREGVTNGIHTGSAGDTSTPIVYIAPDTAENRLILGFNTQTMEERRAAQEKARDENATTVSRKTRLLQESGKQIQHGGFLIYQPIYRNNMPHDTLQQRRQAISGWVYAAFLAEDFLNGLFGKQLDHIDIEVYDGSVITSDAMLFDQDDVRDGNGKRKPLFRSVIHKEILDHPWTIVVSSMPEFEASLNSSKPTLIANIGVVLSLLLSTLLWLLLGRTHTLHDMQAINQELTLSEQRWKFALEGAGDGVWDWDVATGDVHYSKRWKEMIGYSVNELGNSIEEWRSRVHPDDHASVNKALDSYLKGARSSYVTEHRMQCKDGSWKWILDRGMIVARDADNRPTRMIGTHTDISLIKESEEVIWRQANFDTLTGLINRRMFYERLELETRKAARSGFPFALIFLDLDRFKEINDTLGHDKGDALLKDVAERLLECVRETDTVARLGGDEFILLMSDLKDKFFIERLAAKILATLSEPFVLENEHTYISASLGITFYPADANNIDDLMKNVDQAMYAAKNLGRNRFTYFTPEMQEAARKRMLLAKDLREALSKQQFYVLYQPIMNLQTGEIIKAEALIRWTHPEHGIVSPADFIPIAEDNGLILEIGNWVFKQAANQVKEWREHVSANFQVSINRSPVQFYNEKNSHLPWIDYLKSIDLSGSAIVVEITEGLLLDADHNVVNALYKFRDNGIQVALDDFGTGYSSLAYLRKFDIDYIKIDKAFISNLSTNADDLALCSAMIEMAHKLSLKVIAEGVETREQRDLLQQIGCDYAQGYLFSKPVAAAEFTNLLKTSVDENRVPKLKKG